MARGSITQRKSTDGKRTSYRVRWEVRGPDGKRLYPSKTVHTKKEAEALLAAKQAEANAGAFVATSKETVAQYLDRWLAAMAPKWTESTYRCRQSIVRARIAPSLGTVPLSKLDAPRVQTFYNDLTARYAASTVRETHAVLDAALTRAVKWRLITHNPTDDAILPIAPRAVPTTWSSQECEAFLSQVEQHRFGPLWLLALDSGMRIGELLGLGWRDVAIDRDKPTISVRRTTTTDRDGHLKIGEVPKTRTSNRSIIIGADTAAALRSYRAKQAARRLLLGPTWHDLGLVFDRGDGRPIHQRIVSASLDRVLDGLPDLPRLTMHGMRHTMATLALAGGVNPKVVQERLGHSSVQMTLDRYSHVTPSMQGEAAEIISSLLRGDARPKRGQNVS